MTTTKDTRPRYAYRLPDGREIRVIHDHGELPKPTIDYDLGGGNIVAARAVTTPEAMAAIDARNKKMWRDTTARPGAYDPPSPKTELLVLSGRGIRIGVVGHYGLFDETPTFAAAVETARAQLAAGHARTFVAIRIEATLIDGIGDGTERELVRFEVYPDRVALVPRGQGGLSEEQEKKVHALPKKGLL